MDIYNLEERLKTRLRNVKKELDLNKYNNLIHFVESQKSRGIGYAKIYRYTCDAITILKYTNTNIKSWNEKEIMKILSYITERKISDWSKKSMRTTLKRMLETFKKEKYIHLIPTTKINRYIPNILTREEISLILNVAQNQEFKIIFSILWETGCRIGEVLTMKKENISIDSKGLKILISGKTGMRIVRVINYKDQLIDFAKERDNRLFYMSYRMFNKYLKKYAKEAGITKRVYPHLIRHSRATYLSNYFSDSQMKVYFGWTMSSNMTQIYVHLNNRDIDNVIDPSFW